MSSHRKGDLSAATQVKVLSPEIFIIARGQAVHNAETSNGRREKGKHRYGVPGSKSAAGKSTVMSELGRTVRSREIEYHKEAEKATAWKAEAVVGLAHIRGVVTRKCGESVKTHSKGLAEEHWVEDRTMPCSETDNTWIKLSPVTVHMETYVAEVRPKSRMREIRKSGSVRGCSLYFPRLDNVALRASKERRNRENKLNLKEV
ncbi:MAG: hypothetical protein WCV67_01265 [Victivallaceae bacterium]